MRKLLMLAVALVSSLAWGQGQRYQGQLTTAGFPNPTVRVCTEPAVGTPCTPLASLYSDPGLTVPLSNPFTGDASGNYAFYAACGTLYHLQLSGSGLATLDLPNQALPGCSGAAGTPGGLNTQIQINASGAFGGSADLTWLDPTLTVGQSAAVAGVIALGNATGLLTLQSAAGTGTLTLPAATDTLVGQSTTDTLSNKTLASPTLVSPLFSNLISSTANPASGGSINLAASDTILIENAAGNAALTFARDLGVASGTIPADVFQMTGGGLMATAFLSPNSNPASAGILRLANTDSIKGRNAANSGDVQLLGVNSSNQTVVGDANGILLNGPVAAMTTSGALTFSGLGAATAPFAGLPSGSAMASNLNSNFLEGHDWASPGAIGVTVPAAIIATTIQATSASFTGGGNLNTQTSAGLVVNLANDAGNSASWNNTLACINASGHAVPCANGATSGILGICVVNGTGICSNSGSAEIARSGNALCTFNAGGVTVGHYVISDAASNKCADGGATLPSQQWIGVATASGGAGATVNVLVTSGGSSGSGGFANPMTTQYDLIVGGVGGAATRLAGNTANSTLCLTSTGNGTSTTSTAYGACSGTAATALSAITAALAANTVSSLDNAQVWQWSLSTASKSAFTLGESAASTATGTPFLVNIQTLATSTANPLVVTAGGTANGVKVDTTGKLSAIGTGAINATQLLAGTWAIPGAIGATTPNSAAFTTLTASTPIGVASGGTGQSTLGAHGTLLGEGTSGITAVTPGAAGTCWISNGASADPSFQACVGSVSWSGILPPTGNLSVPMGTNTTSFTYGAVNNAFSLSDSTGNTGTGYLLDAHTVGTSTLRPLQVHAQGTANGVYMSSSGLLQAEGAGGIQATSCPNCTLATGIGNYFGNTTQLMDVPSVVYASGTAVTLANAPASEGTATKTVSPGAAVAATTIANVGSNPQTFQAAGYLAQTSLGTGCTGASNAHVNLIYTDPDTGVASTFQISAGLVFATSGSLQATDTGTGNLLRAKAASAIQYSVSFTAGTGCTTNPAYKAYVYLLAW